MTTNINLIKDYTPDINATAGWIGVDLDGTLAEYDGWKGPEHIGNPIPTVVSFVKHLIHRGFDVRIFTARAADVKSIPYIQAWCVLHLEKMVPITNQKDFDMICYIDDRAIAVKTNMGFDTTVLDEYTNNIYAMRYKWLRDTLCGTKWYDFVYLTRPDEDETYITHDGLDMAIDMAIYDEMNPHVSESGLSGDI